jgi:hypothetical protein
MTLEKLFGLAQKEPSFRLHIVADRVYEHYFDKQQYNNCGKNTWTYRYSEMTQCRAKTPPSGCDHGNMLMAECSQYAIENKPDFKRVIKVGPNIIFDNAMLFVTMNDKCYKLKRNNGFLQIYASNLTKDQLIKTLEECTTY